MSVYLPTELLTSNDVRNLKKDLLVKETPAGNKFISPVYQTNLKAVECYDDCVIDETEYSVIPFSYYKKKFSQNEEENKYPIRDTECKTVETLQFKGELLDRQKEVKKEVVKILNETNSVVLSLHTGFGKTVMALYFCCKIGLRTIVLCHRKIIIEQWITSIEKYIPNATFCILGDKPTKKYMREHPQYTDEKDADILVCNVINVPKRKREFYKEFGTVIIDEIHTVCTESFSKSLLYLFPEYIIGLSATPFRSDGMDRIIDLFCGSNIIFRKLYKPFNAYRFNTGITLDIKENISGQMDWNSVLESQVESDKRNDMIVKLCLYFCTKNILILVKRVDHAIRLKQLLINKGEIVDTFMDTKKTFNEDCRILIATFSKGGVGFDFPKLNMLICGGDVKENFAQYIGRIFRRDDVNPIYIDLVDEMKTIKTHSTERMKFCKEIGAEVKPFQKTFKDFEFWSQYL